jgi:DNA-binding LacI/PurR family transcriptional regulator
VAEEQLTHLIDALSLPTGRLAATGPGDVCGDNSSGFTALMRHLLRDRGVTRPVLIRGTAHQPDSIRREQLFRDVLAAHGLPVDEQLILDGEFWHGTAYRELRRLLRARRDFDAVVAANDISALGALKALNDEGLRVPRDVLLTGFDNDPAARNWPGLTTVDEDLEAQGAAAARQFLLVLPDRDLGAAVAVAHRFQSLLAEAATGHPAHAHRRPVAESPDRRLAVLTAATPRPDAGGSARPAAGERHMGDPGR